MSKAMEGEELELLKERGPWGVRAYNKIMGQKEALKKYDADLKEAKQRITELEDQLKDFDSAMERRYLDLSREFESLKKKFNALKALGLTDLIDIK